MSEPHLIKQGDLAPSITVILTDADGNPVEIQGDVKFRMRTAAPPYTLLIDDAAATPDPDQVTNTGKVTYEWQAGDTDTPGDYLAEWFLPTFDQTFPTLDYNRVTVTDALTSDWPTPPIVSLGDVETAVGRTLTQVEAARAAQLIEQVTDTLSIYLNRDIVPTRHVETHTIGVDGYLKPYRGPVRSVESIAVDGAAAVTTYNDVWDSTVWDPGTSLVVTYTAGDDPRPAVAAVIIDAVAGAIIAGNAVASGAIRGYSVEGTSITYGAAAGGDSGQTGRFSVASLKGIKRLRRPVLR